MIRIFLLSQVELCGQLYNLLFYSFVLYFHILHMNNAEAKGVISQIYEKN